MGKHSRNKGSAFERKVAAAFAQAIGVGKRDIYRTPLSGGHPYADTGDLVFTPEARVRWAQRFSDYSPIVECKHHKSWRVEYLFRPDSRMRSWCAQVLAACQRSRLPNPQPILVVRGNGGLIFALRCPAHDGELFDPPYALVRMAGRIWLAEPLAGFLLARSSGPADGSKSMKTKRK